MLRDDFFHLLNHLTPTALAEPWDNVGLLLDPLPPLLGKPAQSTGAPESPDHVHRVLVAIDLTEPVLAEALHFGADVLIAYHPPIFSGLKRLTRATPMTRRLLTLARAGVAVWSPHTALDAIVGGMNDWLASGCGEASESAPIQPCATTLDPPRVDLAGAGLGRLITLSEPASLTTLVARLKAHLHIPHARVAAAPNSESIARVALCPGAGGSLFGPLPSPAAGGPQLYVTGEWGHHDVLAKVAQGASVILTEHSNTERGFLPTYAEWLRGQAGVEVRVSTGDADPLTVW